MNRASTAKVKRVISVLFLISLFWMCTNVGLGGFSSWQASALAADQVEEPREEPDVEAGEIADPLENWNRAMFSINDRFYFWVLKPIATAYRCVIPEGLRISIRNAFDNIKFPIRFVNNIPQCKMRESGTEFARFTINSTLGFAGFFDVANTHFKLPAHDEDTGQTLGHWGVGPGIYLVWPLLGPSTARDTVGTAGDWALNPIHWLADDELISGGTRAGQVVNNTSLRLGEYEEFKKATLDPYVAMRQAYVQHRQKEIRE